VGDLLLLSVPGFVLPARSGRLAYPHRTALVVLAVSVAIETAQWLLPIGRVASIDDVILNTISAALAACASRGLQARRPVPVQPPVDADAGGS
jgi:glycopeptide antibiotics resistance protein